MITFYILLDQQQIKLLGRMETKMMSGAGKFYQKCRKINPSTKKSREKMYASSEKVYEQRKGSGQKKFSPFNTISRESRDSYLLRITYEPNTQTNYQVNCSPTLKRERTATIDQAMFKRIIGPVNENDYSIRDYKIKSARCSAALSESKRPIPLTARDVQKWRIKHENLDFSKQLNPERSEIFKQLKSTFDSNVLHSLKETTQSNFNNYKRFSLVPNSSKVHNFNSYSGHKYLQDILGRNIEPEYDILKANQEIVRKAMKKPKGEFRFNLFRDQIKTRVDRADPNWMQTLDYGSTIEYADKNKKKSIIDFDLMEPRLQNEIHSKYPIRQALRMEVPNNKVN